MNTLTLMYATDQQVSEAYERYYDSQEESYEYEEKETVDPDEYYDLKRERQD